MYFSRQILIFIIIGLITVLIDYLTYRCLFFFFSDVAFANGETKLMEIKTYPCDMFTKVSSLTYTYNYFSIVLRMINKK